MTAITDADYLSLKEIETIQQDKWLVQRQYMLNHSEFYNELWNGQIPPKRLKDTAILPLSDKSQLRELQELTPPYGSYLATSRKTIRRHHRTSGTTGQAMNLALSARDCEITESVGARSQRAAGVTANHTVVHCLNYQMWMGGITDHLILERTGATVVPYGIGGTEKLIETIQAIGINAISCTPSYPLVLERVIEEKFPGLQPHDLGLKLGLFGGEAGLDDELFRSRIKNIWGMEPRNANYGVSDVLCNFAAQCEHDTRLHFLANDVLYPELIDPESGESIILKSGQKGELVLTHLARDCQPLVRFKTGDIISVDETEPCECGRTGFRFRVIGRSDDMVVVRGLNLFPTMVASVINEFSELSGNYRIFLDQPPPYNFLPVKVELAKGEISSEQLRQNIEDAIKKKLGATAKIEILPADSFPITEGKTNRVIKSYL